LRHKKEIRLDDAVVNWVFAIWQEVGFIIACHTFPRFGLFVVQSADFVLNGSCDHTSLNRRFQLEEREF
jgi:hypothetical protein